MILKMKTRKKSKLSLLFIMVIMTLFFISCEDENDNKPKVNIPVPDPIINFNPNVTYGSMTDIDGNVYKTFIFNGKTWMAENLKVTRYRNGEAIPNVKDSADWISLTTGAYCDYNNQPEISQVFGRLYNGYARTDSRNIAPEGWHIATSSEWYSLLPFIPWNMGLIKETDTTHWKSPNTGATNETGFTALPTGQRYPDFSGIYENCYYDTSDNASGLFAFYYNSTSHINWMGSNLIAGLPVRCVKD